MAIRLLPFRDYDEHDVVNLFKSAGTLEQFIDLSQDGRRSTPQGDAGVFVKVLNGSLNAEGKSWDPIDIDAQKGADSLLGKTDYPNVAKNFYPEATLSVTGVSSASDACIGVTLRQTVARDELGENLLYNPVKKDELYGVLPGEVVPVLSKGMVTITDDAVNGTMDVGDSIVPSVDGTVSGVNGGVVTASQNKIGTVLAKGHRNDYTNALGGTNVFGNAALQSGAYYLVKIDCA